LINIYQNQFFTDVLKLRDDLSEDLGGDVLVFAYKLIETIFLKKGVFVQELFKKNLFLK
jgi:hypothetical protein